jgi:hypothetical protein
MESIMYKTKLANPKARKAAAESLRVARATFTKPNEIFGFAITIATNMNQIERDGGNRAAASAYSMAARALDRAAPLALS